MKKYLQKKLLLSLVALFATISAVAEDAQLLSFGFYKANNPGLAKDYVATVPALTSGKTSYDIEIALPENTDLTALVAKFTVNQGNTVSIYGVSQVSGTTPNDFTDPVDYTVSNSNKSSNLRYTVTVVEEKAVSRVWKEISVLDPVYLTGVAGVTGVYSGAVMKINPKDDIPYVAFGVRGADNRLTVAKFDGSEWSKVGDASFTHKVSGSYYHMDIASDGTPYVAFNDQEATNKGGMSVMKYNGTAWEYVGDAGFTPTTAQYVGIAALDGALVTSQQENGRSGAFTRRSMVVSTNSGTSWDSQAPASALAGYVNIADNGQVAYVYCRNASAPNACHIFKIDSEGQITPVVENYIPQGAESIFLTGAEMMVAPDGTLFLMVADAVPGGNYMMEIQVYKDGKFKYYGGDALPVDFGANGYVRQWIMKPALSSEEIPYIVYNKYTEDNNLYMVYYDPETGWVRPIKIMDAPKKKADDLNFAFDSKGDAYLSFTDGDNKIHLLKYAAVEETVGISTQMNIAVEKTELFDLSGKRSSSTGKGLYIQRTVGADGKVITKKVLK